jgi:hypothetical protein
MILTSRRSVKVLQQHLDRRRRRALAAKYDPGVVDNEGVYRIVKE